ncbi:MAG TPA: MraY family glycosyltransferase [Defluviitoga sp.]|nr:MraY family glycosyltransferase [Defluviitoga sp.]HOP24415.1 MraY family glycosyltransferase [Defluviitoga sp.]HPZ28748.1 MraY family glycosyltransferase [Defluviitoga sp.]HQD62750.1 MraY family glycosyltransferase [Defluviitoga sp.]
MSFVKILSAFLLSVIFTPVMIRIAKKYNIVDQPDNKLKSHKDPTPYLGGIAIFLSILPFYIFDLSFILPASILTFIGLYDDIKDISPLLRLLAEFIVVSMSVYMVGEIKNPFHFILLVITGTALINGVNMVDGMDGVCAGTVIISLIFFAVILKNYDLLIFVAAIIGFLLYNFYPAKIFLGDAGSYFLGFMLFYSFLFLSGKFGRDGYFISFIITGFYFVDLFYAVLRRLLNKTSPFLGDKEHIYNKIRRKYNISPILVSFVTYIISFIFGIIGLIAWDFQVVGVIIVIVLFLFIGYHFKLYKYEI